MLSQKTRDVWLCHIFASVWNTNITATHKVRLTKQFHGVFDMFCCSNIIHHTGLWLAHTVPRFTSGNILSRNWDSILWGDKKSARSWLLLSSGCCRSFCKESTFVWSSVVETWISAVAFKYIWLKLSKCRYSTLFRLPCGQSHIFYSFCTDRTDCGFVCFIATEFMLWHTIFHKIPYVHDATSSRGHLKIFPWWSA